MFIIIVFSFIALALIAELGIYFALISRKGKTIKRLYLLQALVCNLPVMILMVFSRNITLDPFWGVVLMWANYIFMVSVFPKITLNVFLLIRRLLRLLVRRWSFMFVQYIGYGLSLVVLSVMLYGGLWGRTDLRVEELTIYNENLPSAFDGFKVAMFTDAHVGNFGTSYGLLEEMVEEINGYDVDAVMQGGDLVNLHSGELTEEVVEILSDIEAPVYSVLGNHDLAYYIADTLQISPSGSRAELAHKQLSMGWNLLLNDGEWIYRGADSIYIGGTTYPSNNPHNGFRSDAGTSDIRSVMRPVSHSNYSIVVAHTPKLFDSIYTDMVRPDLMLSGHTHSMQFKLKCGDWQWSPAEWLYENYSGLYNDGKKLLYVNDGLGYVGIPFRFGARPELTIFTLKSTK